MGDAPHPHPGSRGTRLTVPGADTGTWWELQAVVTVSGNPRPRWGQPSHAPSDVGCPPAPHPHRALVTRDGCGTRHAGAFFTLTQ